MLYFAWALLTICDSLLMFQMELVEYILITIPFACVELISDFVHEFKI